MTIKKGKKNSDKCLCKHRNIELRKYNGTNSLQRLKKMADKVNKQTCVHKINGCIKLKIRAPKIATS